MIHCPSPPDAIKGYTHNVLLAREKGKNILTKDTEDVLCRFYMATKNTLERLKKAPGLVPAIVHARAKASAAMHGQDFQDWVAEAIQEKLEREERARAAAGKEAAR
jgi:hypothetical protein